MACTVNVKLEDVYPDGGFGALIGVYGSEFAIAYIAGEIRVRSTAGASTYDRRPRWQRKSHGDIAHQWAAERIAAQPPEWHAAHAALYAEEG
jgi:hypothetical protein